MPFLNWFRKKSRSTEVEAEASSAEKSNPEPIPAGHPILRMANVILAPHIASASVAAVKKLRETAANLALRAVRGEPLQNIVN